MTLTKNSASNMFPPKAQIERSEATSSQLSFKVRKSRHNEDSFQSQPMSFSQSIKAHKYNEQKSGPNLGINFHKKQLGGMMSTMHASSMPKIDLPQSFTSTPKNMTIKNPNKLICTPESQRAQLLAFTMKRNRSQAMQLTDMPKERELRQHPHANISQLPPVTTQNFMRAPMNKMNVTSMVLLQKGQQMQNKMVQSQTHALLGQTATFLNSQKSQKNSSVDGHGTFSQQNITINPLINHTDSFQNTDRRACSPGSKKDKSFNTNTSRNYQNPQPITQQPKSKTQIGSSNPSPTHQRKQENVNQNGSGLKMRRIKLTKAAETAEKDKENSQASPVPSTQKLVKIRKTKSPLVPNLKLKPKIDQGALGEEDNSNRCGVFYSNMHTSTTMEQDAARRRTAALQDDSVKLTAKNSTDVIDGSASNFKSRDNSNLKSRGSRSNLPFMTEGNSKEVIEQNFYGQNNQMSFTIGRNQGQTYLSSNPSRNVGLITAQFEQEDSDKRKKMLTHSDDKYANGNRRGSSKVRNNEMFRASNDSLKQSLIKCSPEFLVRDSSSKEFDGRDGSLKPSETGLKLQDKINNLCVTQQNSASDEFQLQNSVSKTSPQKREIQQMKGSTPKNKFSIPPLKLPLSNDVSNSYYTQQLPKKKLSGRQLMKNSTADNLHRISQNSSGRGSKGTRGSDDPSNFYNGNNNICKIKIRKNFKKIQIHNNKIVSNPFAKQTVAQQKRLQELYQPAPFVKSGDPMIKAAFRNFRPSKQSRNSANASESRPSSQYDTTSFSKNELHCSPIKMTVDNRGSVEKVSEEQRTSSDFERDVTETEEESIKVVAMDDDELQDMKDQMNNHRRSSMLQSFNNEQQLSTVQEMNLSQSFGVRNVESTARKDGSPLLSSLTKERSLREPKSMQVIRFHSRSRGDSSVNSNEKTNQDSLNQANKLKLTNRIDGQDGGVKTQIRESASQDNRSRNAEFGKIVYKKIKIIKIKQQIKKKPTVNQTNRIFDELVSHLEAKNGSDQDLVSCLRMIQTESANATDRELNKGTLSVAKQISDSQKDATKQSIKSSMQEKMRKSHKKVKKQKSFQQEFMENYDQFSQSWRDEIDRAHGKRHARQEPGLNPILKNAKKVGVSKSQNKITIDEEAIVPAKQTSKPGVDEVSLTAHDLLQQCASQQVKKFLETTQSSHSFKEFSSFYSNNNQVVRHNQA